MVVVTLSLVIGVLAGAVIPTFGEKPCSRQTRYAQYLATQRQNIELQLVVAIEENEKLKEILDVLTKQIPSDKGSEE
jgi:uncharacterized membrane-anchored protein YhcB (DUF1043 family)